MNALPTFSEINTFVVVAEHSSFAKAALSLGVGVSTVSMSIRNLEDRLGSRLFNRTTRSVALTDIGERLLPHLRLMLADYRAALEAINESADTPAGVIRLHVRAAIYQVTLEPVLAQFFRKYPKIKIDVSTDMLESDLVAGHFDLGIAMYNNIPRDMVAIRISDDLPIVMAGAPSYLAAYGYPQTPEDLKQHNCIRYRSPHGKVAPWQFGKGAKVIEVAATGPLIHNHFTATVRAAVDGIGLVRSPLLFVQHYIDDGRLIEVLPEWTTMMRGYYIYYPSRRHIPAHLRTLIEFLKANFQTGGTEAPVSGPADNLIAIDLD